MVADKPHRDDFGSQTCCKVGEEVEDTTRWIPGTALDDCIFLFISNNCLCLVSVASKCFRTMQYAAYCCCKNITQSQLLETQVCESDVAGVFFLLQSRSQTLQKQLQEMQDQMEQTVVELRTFENLRQHEIIAVPKRVEVCAYQHFIVIKLRVCLALYGN